MSSPARTHRTVPKLGTRPRYRRSRRPSVGGSGGRRRRRRAAAPSWCGAVVVVGGRTGAGRRRARSSSPPAPAAAGDALRRDAAVVARRRTAAPRCVTLTSNCGEGGRGPRPRSGRPRRAPRPRAHRRTRRSSPGPDVDQLWRSWVGADHEAGGDVVRSPPRPSSTGTCTGRPPAAARASVLGHADDVRRHGDLVRPRRHDEVDRRRLRRPARRPPGPCGSREPSAIVVALLRRHARRSGSRRR